MVNRINRAERVSREGRRKAAPEELSRPYSFRLNPRDELERGLVEAIKEYQDTGGNVRDFILDLWEHANGLQFEARQIKIGAAEINWLMDNSEHAVSLLSQLFEMVENADFSAAKPKSSKKKAASAPKIAVSDELDVMLNEIMIGRGALNEDEG